MMLLSGDFDLKWFAGWIDSKLAAIGKFIGYDPVVLTMWLIGVVALIYLLKAIAGLFSRRKE